jgi:hypothetical protein
MRRGAIFMSALGLIAAVGKMTAFGQKQTLPSASMSMLPPTVIFCFDETGVLNIYGSLGDAVMAWEGVDVESGVVRFYDGNGVSLMPKFIMPNRSGRIFSWFRWVESGAYELVPNEKPEDSFALALFEARVLEPNEWVDSIEQLKSDLRSSGIDIDFRPGN